MAFIIDNFSTIGSNARKGEAPQQFSYENDADSLNTIKAAGYFNEVSFLLSDDDMISVIARDGMGIMHVTSSDPVAGVVVIDNNIISNQGGSDNSAAFHNIFTLADFPVQDANTITLEDGVNYLVFIEGPISSPKGLVLDNSGLNPYGKGGSLRYMGQLGVLVWTLTAGGNSMIFGDSLSGQATFLVEGFEFISESGIEGNALNISGISESNKMDNVTVRNCIFKEFGAPFDFMHIDELMFENVLIDIDTTTQTKPSLDITECENLRFENCEIIASDGQFALDTDLQEITKGYFGNVDFTGDSANGLIRLDMEGGPPTGSITFTHCNAFSSPGTVGVGLAVKSRNIIDKILDDNGKPEIFFRNTMTFDGSSKVAVNGTRNYNGLFDVSSVKATTIVIDTSFSAENFAGQVSQGSLDPFGSNIVRVNESIGFINPTPSFATSISGSDTVQTIPLAAIYQEFTYGENEVIQGINGFGYDFALFSFIQNSIQYKGQGAALVRVFLSMTLQGSGATNDYSFRFQRENSSQVQQAVTFPWGFKVGTDATEKLHYSFLANILMDPLDIIVPQFKQDSGTSSITVTDMQFELRI